MTIPFSVLGWTCFVSLLISALFTWWATRVNPVGMQLRYPYSIFACLCACWSLGQTSVLLVLLIVASF